MRFSVVVDVNNNTNRNDEPEQKQMYIFVKNANFSTITLEATPRTIERVVNHKIIYFAWTFNALPLRNDLEL